MDVFLNNPAGGDTGSHSGSRGTKLCPNCARQGQIFPNGSKQNPKYGEKLE
jgi:hypothetical protein